MKHVFFALALVGLVGCSTTSEVKTLQPATGQILSASTVALEVTTQGADEDSRAVAAQVRDQLFGKLVSRGKFEAVRPADADAPYAMSVVVSDVATVSVGARILVGVLAGGDELTATVTLKDTESGATVRNFQVKTEAAAHWLSSEYGIDNAVGQLTDRIVQGL